MTRHKSTRRSSAWLDSPDLYGWLRRAALKAEGFSKQLSEKIATPEGLIYLFHKPNEFIEQIRQLFKFKNALPLEKINPPVVEKKSLELEGPNVPNLSKRIKYAFFTEPDSFRLSFNEAGLSFTIEWRIQGIFWKVVRLEIPIKKI